MGDDGYGVGITENRLYRNGDFYRHHRQQRRGPRGIYALKIDDDGTSGFSGGISNSGAITSTADDGIEIEDIANSGTFSSGNISNSGTISAEDYGLYIDDVGTSSFAGNISNSGAITAFYEYGFDVTQAGPDGNFTGNIGNSGAITAMGDDGYGIEITEVAEIGTATFSGNISNSGSIRSYDNAFFVQDVGTSSFFGNITNSGTISSSEEMGIEIAGVADSGKFTGNIGNSAAISAESYGIYMSEVGSGGFAGNISNSGKIASADNYGIYLADIAGGGSFTGNIDNSGTVSAHDYGIYLSDVGNNGFNGNISNSGAIVAGDEFGINISDAGDDGNFIGNIANTGAITAFGGTEGYGIHVTGVAAGGAATFAGRISNGGAIQSHDTGLYIDEVGITAFSGSITNSGAITAGAGDGVYIANVADEGTFSGGIINTAAIAAFGYGIYIDDVGAKGLSGGISNAGTISVSGKFTATGIYIANVASNGTFAGNIVNSAPVTAYDTAISIDQVGGSGFDGNIVNGGKIEFNSSRRVCHLADRVRQRRDVFRQHRQPGRDHGHRYRPLDP